MSTERQKNLATEIVLNAKRPKNKRKNKKDLVVSVGYSKTVAKAKPQLIIAQKGVQEELEVLGFNPHAAKSVVAEIMLNKEAEPNARLKATDQVFKVSGTYAPEKSVNVNVNMENKEKIKTIADKVIEKMKEEESDHGKSHK